MKILLFPKQDGSVKNSYYEAYYKSVVRSAEYVGIKVVETTNDRVWCGGSINAFSCSLDGRQFIMDFSDLQPFQLDPGKYNCPYFKWHYSYNYLPHVSTPHTYPLCILMDFDWDRYSKIRGIVKYKADGKILNNQRPRHAAKSRRERVRRMLLNEYQDRVNYKFTDREIWWRLHGDCLVVVAVPGARNNMLDRGHWESMGLGACVVCPEIVTMLAGNKRIQPFVHHVPVKDDYSNLIDAIEWCKVNREECKRIGQESKKLFDSIAPPFRYWSYIQKVLTNGQ